MGFFSRWCAHGVSCMPSVSPAVRHPDHCNTYGVVALHCCLFKRPSSACFKPWPCHLFSDPDSSHLTRGSSDRWTCLYFYSNPYPSHFMGEIHYTQTFCLFLSFCSSLSLGTEVDAVADGNGWIQCWQHQSPWWQDSTQDGQSGGWGRLARVQHQPSSEQVSVLWHPQMSSEQILHQIIPFHSQDKSKLHCNNALLKLVQCISEPQNVLSLISLIKRKRKQIQVIGASCYSGNFSQLFCKVFFRIYTNVQWFV